LRVEDPSAGRGKAFVLGESGTNQGRVVALVGVAVGVE
jgi:hypothetical protein